MSACLKENLTSHAFDGILSYAGLHVATSGLYRLSSDLGGTV